MKVREVVDAVEQDNCSSCSSSTCGSCKIDAGDNGFNSALSLEISEEKLRAAGWCKMPSEKDIFKFLCNRCRTHEKCTFNASEDEHCKTIVLRAKSIITFLGGGK
jgi:hypothetical protein